MIGQVTPGSFSEPIVAQLQSDVGTFLGLKQRLLGARLLPVAPEQQAALQRAYSAQLALEAQLTDVTAAVARLQAGQINFTDSITAGGFLTEMEIHLRSTQSLLAGLPAAPVTAVDWGKVVLWGGGALATWWALKTGSKGLVWAGLALGGYMLWRNATPATVAP